MIQNNTERTAFLAPENHLYDLLKELPEPCEIYKNLILCNTSEVKKTPYLVQNIWHDAKFIEIVSIKDGVKKLRNIQRNWALYNDFDFHRRCALIQEQLPYISAKPVQFPSPLPTGQLGSWCLVDKNMILAASNSSSPYPNGEIHFEENKTEPPNRAYLKLWDALTQIQKFPNPSDICLDLGACPGGWTWVLQQLGAKVISIDKAPLEPHIAELPNVTYRQGSAFALDPEDIGHVDWLFSDIICYPERLLRLVNNWIASKLVKNMVCTIKLQGETNFDIINEFANISGATIIHLYNNKHELTWIWSDPEQ